MSRLEELKKDCHEKMAAEMCDHLAAFWHVGEYKKVSSCIINAPEDLASLLCTGVAERIPEEGKRTAFFNYIRFQENNLARSSVYTTTLIKGELNV